MKRLSSEPFVTAKTDPIIPIISEIVDSLKPLEWRNSLDWETIHDGVVIEGFTKKFSIPNVDGVLQARLHEEAIKGYLEIDDRRFTTLDIPSLEKVRSYFARKLKFNNYMRYIKAGARMVAIPKDDYLFLTSGPGETAISRKGICDLVTKLEREWSASFKANEYACILLWQFRGIRRFIANPSISSVRGLDGRKIRTDKKRLGASASKIAQNLRSTFKETYSTCFDTWGKAGRIIPIPPGQEQMRIPRDVYVAENTLLSLSRLFLGGRFFTLPKNNTARRCAQVQPLLDQLIQGCTMRILADYCDKINNNLLNAQDRHRKLVLTGRYATIDLKSGSDCNYRSVARRLLPSWLWSLIDTGNSEFVEFTSKDAIHLPVGHQKFLGVPFIKQNKVASMGSLTTFGLMTAILLTSLRVLLGTNDIFVFGDDVLVPVKHFEASCKILQQLGFIINHDKSFPTGVLGETCGVYQFKGKPIPRFDFRCPMDALDVLLFTNKIKIILAEQTISNSLAEKLGRLTKICDAFLGGILDSSFNGPVVTYSELPWGEYKQVIPNWIMIQEGTDLDYSDSFSKQFWRPVYIVNTLRRKTVVDRRYDLYGPLGTVVALQQGTSVQITDKRKEVLSACKMLIGSDGLVIRTRRKSR